MPASVELQPFAQAQPAAPAAPAASDYKPCDCMGKSPLRACRHCGCSGWMKLCRDCFGHGTLVKQSRQLNAQGRTERCGFCMGVGWTPCPKAEVARAEELFGQVSVPAQLAPSPAQVEKRVQVRRASVMKGKKMPKRQTRAGVSISAERLNPVEVGELEREGDTPAVEPLEVAPSSFAPEE